MEKTPEWFVYMLLCDQKTFYVGITNDIVSRFRQHKTSQSFYTKQFSDIRLAYAEQYDSKRKAALREKQLKGWSHAKKQLLVQRKLGINDCTEFVEVLLTRSKETS